MPEENEVNLYDYIKVIIKRKWLIVIGTFVCILTVAIVTLLLPRVYETRATLTMVGPDTPDVKVGVLTIPTGISLDKFFNFLPDNKDLNLEVIRKLGLDKSPDELTPQALSQTVTFNLPKGLTTIAINVRYSHPEKARDIADTMAEVMKDYYQVLNEVEIAQFQALIDEQLNLVQTRLLEVKKNLQALKETVDVDSLREEIQTRSSQETSLAQEYLKVKMSLIEQEARLTRAEKELQKQDKFYVLSKSIAEDLAYKGILEKLSREDIAAVLAAKDEREEINPIYSNLERTITNARIFLAGAEAKEPFLKKEIEENKLILSKLRTQLAEKEPEWEYFTEISDLAEKDYQIIHNTYGETARLLAAAKGHQLKTVGTAPTPTSPIEPKTKRILLVAAIVGLLAALFLAFFLEYLEKMRKLEAESKKQDG